MTLNQRIEWDTAVNQIGRIGNMTETVQSVQTDGYKIPGTYTRDNYNEACKCAQELFDSDERIYEVHIRYHENYRNYCNLEPLSVHVYRDIFPKHYYEGEHVEKCASCGCELTVPARKHGSKCAYVCSSCFDLDDVPPCLDYDI